MRPQGIDPYLAIETALGDFVREVVREELRKLSAETREPPNGPTGRSQADSDELLTVAQVARELQVVPPTARTWSTSLSTAVA